MQAEIWDVFTRRTATGNALAVVFGSDGADTTSMQRTAREFGLSETVFVQRPPEVDGDVAPVDARLRIFTPTRELDIAGHPTLGAAHAIRRRSRAPREHLRLLSNVGPVDVHFDDTLAWMHQGTPRPCGATDRRREVATALGLDARAIHPLLPIEAWTIGTPFLLVPLVDAEALNAARLDLGHLRAHGGTEVLAVLAFVPPSGDEGVLSRGLVEALGIPEDPGTGSAHGPLAAYLLAHGWMRAPTLDAATHAVHLQGVRMGRRSDVHVRAVATDGGVQIWVGGEAVPFMLGGSLVDVEPRADRRTDAGAGDVRR